MRFDEFVGPSYTSQSINAECQQTMNWYPERLETKGVFAMYPCPGRRLAYDLGAIGPGRGLYTLNGRTFAVSGTVLWELFGDGTIVNRSGVTNIVSDGGPVSFAGGPTQVLFASAGVPYVFNMSTNTLTNISSQISNVLMVGYTDGIFIALLADGSLRSTDFTNGIDATNWPGDNKALVEVFTDHPNAIFVDHREVWVFGPKAIQPYIDAGDVPFQFDVISGAFIESGLAAPFSIAKLDNSIFWLGADERGQGVVRRANGYTAVRVSNHAVEFAIQNYSTISDAVAYGYQDQGHEFYVLSFPTADKTWVYDAATNQWHERGFWNSQAGRFTRVKAQYHTFNFGKHLVLDPTAAKVYEQSINILDDDGSNIKRVRRATHISNEQEYISYDQMQVMLETGLATFDNPLGATSYTLQSPNGMLWTVKMSDLGSFQTAANGTDDPDTLVINAQTGNSFQLTISNIGVVKPVQIATDSYDSILPFISVNGVLLWNMQISDVGSGIGIIQTVPQGKNQRGPLLTLRYSKDFGHSWSSDINVDCGQLGEYRARAMFRRLGRSRDRVFEISTSDPVPWRISDCFLKVS